MGMMPRKSIPDEIRLTEAFAQGTGHGLLRLGAGEVGQALPPVFVWWRDFAARYVAALCLHAPARKKRHIRSLPDVPAPDEAELSSLVLTAPMMTGAEYLTPEVLRACGTRSRGAHRHPSPPREPTCRAS